ncbi:hypothetical protein [Amycolatopsis cihanbeyliensis]|uniref:Uncharacterized protein n=1 Tax=Amycolatopsis cihanbeyliensis TaxID=1128664 RepID=A0A542DR17_AMYCI|nr:hypothetical protein [Amycolatopsis cihanbeyliensis]TQJ05434.1 hypothetical protein FB471_5264 [Amycolatopsis cihanbeyliensis]
MTDGDWPSSPPGWLAWRGELHYITGYSRGRENGGIRGIIACVDQRIVHEDHVTVDPPKCQTCAAYAERRRAELTDVPPVLGGWGGWQGVPR